MMLFMSDEPPGVTPSDPDFYATFYTGGNAGGLHNFPGHVAGYFTDLYSLVTDSENIEGASVKWVDKVSGATVISFRIHKNGRIGTIDLDLDTVIIEVNQIALLPQDVQTLIYGTERTPDGGRN